MTYHPGPPFSPAGPCRSHRRRRRASRSVALSSPRHCHSCPCPYAPRCLPRPGDPTSMRPRVMTTLRTEWVFGRTARTGHTVVQRGHPGPGVTSTAGGLRARVAVSPQTRRSAGRGGRRAGLRHKPQSAAPADQKSFEAAAPRGLRAPSATASTPPWLACAR